MYNNEPILNKIICCGSVVMAARVVVKVSVMDRVGGVFCLCYKSGAQEYQWYRVYAKLSRILH